MLHSFWVSRSRLVAGGTKISRKNVQNNVEHSSLSVTIQIFMAISLKHDLDHLCMNFFIWDTRQHSEGRVWMHISRSLLSFHSLMSWADQDQKIFNGLKKYLSSSENICPDGCKWRVMIRAAGRELGHGVNVKTKYCGRKEAVFVLYTHHWQLM